MKFRISNLEFRIAVTCLLLSARSPLFALTSVGSEIDAGFFSPSPTAFGDILSIYGARSAAMGGATLTLGEPSSLFLNPAALNAVEVKRLVLSATPRFTSFFEKWDRGIVTAQPVKNNPTYLKLNEASLTYALAKGRVSVGLGVAPILDQSYRWKERSFENGSLDDENTVSSDGGLVSYSAGFAFGIVESFSMGAAADVLRGKRRASQLLDIRTNGALTSRQDFRLRETLFGSSFRLGALLRVKRFSLGGFYRFASRGMRERFSENEFSIGNSTGIIRTSENFHFDLPEQWGIGFSNLFDDKLRTLLSAEILFHGFGGTGLLRTHKNGVELSESSTTIQGLVTVPEIRIGIEHWLTKDIPVRYGFTYSQSYREWDVSVLNSNLNPPVVLKRKERPEALSLSAGTGYRLGVFSWDLSYRLTRRSFAPPSFPFAETFSTNETTHDFFITTKVAF